MHGASSKTHNLFYDYNRYINYTFVHPKLNCENDLPAGCLVTSIQIHVRIRSIKINISSDIIFFYR